MRENSMSNEKFREICREAIPVIKKLQEIVEQNDIKQGIRVYIGEDGYFSMEGNGLGGWEVHNYDGETTIRHEYREVFKMEGEDSTDKQ